MTGTPPSPKKRRDIEAAQLQDARLNGSEGETTVADVAATNIQRLARGKTGRSQAHVEALRLAHESHRDAEGAAAVARHTEKMRQRRRECGEETDSDRAHAKARFDAEVRQIEEERKAHAARHRARVAKQKKKRWKRSTRNLILIQRGYRRRKARQDARAPVSIAAGGSADGTTA
jgi:hypothetical protein